MLFILKYQKLAFEKGNVEQHFDRHYNATLRKLPFEMI